MVVVKFAGSGRARAQLVADLCDQEALQSDAVAAAFRAVPREAFVTAFYEQQQERPWKWLKRTSDQYEPQAWLASIYRDAPLVTLVSERNMPISSSSMPTVMALMLDALEVKPGMRVLEIGTGTGYNAALLAHLVGDPALVTTIDLEESLARSAQRALQEQSGSVSVHVGDGRLGVPERAPYERILATASAPGIPLAWYEQLAPGGRLIMDLQGSLHKSSFFLVDKAADGSATGHFDTRELHFMPLRPGDDLANRPVARLLQESVTRQITLPDDEYAATLLQNEAFHWLLQWFAPGISLARAQALEGSHAGHPFVTIIDALKTTILQLYQRDGQWSGHERGAGGLWETLERAFQLWQGLGRPALSAYYVEWDRQKELFRLLVRQGSATLAFDL